MTTNLDLAPPVTTVDGLVAVPVDIQQIDVTLTLDGASSSGAGDATVQFTTGIQAGNPIFDIRQTVTGVWLDGSVLPAGQFVHHDFGGGPNAELRVLQSSLPASTSHTLRVTYSLGTPQAPSAGSYQPAMTWSAGPRLTFNFGFTDLGPGRYLESWVPANLIYDQFLLNVTVLLLNTSVGHSVITNGQATALGANHWSIAFPGRFTAFSPLLEIRATDTLAFASDTVMLPVSGTTVTIEAWKLVTSAVSLSSQIASLKTWLVDNESSIGGYLHGNRFVCFLNIGGMEYDGGTTTANPSLRHETHHSWWGRGVKPASQSDAWWDEAWTVYHDNGAIGAMPFDFTEPAVILRPANPWVRITAAGAYSNGERFFRGLAALAGVPNLRDAMAAFYRTAHDRPATTAQLEAFLISRLGSADAVDGFHRFVYGLPDPTASTDLWLRDNLSDPGNDWSAGTFWNSPDLWIRNNDDGGTTSQAPEYGQDNWFYARVRNRGSATVGHFVVTFNVVPYAGTEFVYPGDFLPSVAAVAEFDLPAGGVRVVKARWPAAAVPSAGTHACLLASIISRGDHPVAGRHVWEHNNLAQRNLTIVDLVPDDWFVLPFVLNRFSFRPRTRIQLDLVRPTGWAELPGRLLHPEEAVFARRKGLRRQGRLEAASRPAQLECGGRVPADGLPGYGIWAAGRPIPAVAARFESSLEADFAPGPVSSIAVATQPNTPLFLGLWLRVPAEAKPGTLLACTLRHREGKRIVGGFAVEIRVQQKRASEPGPTALSNRGGGG